jgi:hypothetical protein
MTTALVLAAAAVAYLLWTRPAVAPALPQLPPLSPIIPPGIMPLGMPGAAAGGGGPHPLTLLAILAAGAMVAFAIRETRTPPPAPAPGPAPVVGLDLRGRFVGPDASQDAAVTAALLGALADDIEYDGLPVDKEGKPKETRLKTGASFDDLRRIAREIRCQGVSLGARQPAVRDEIKRFLDAEAGTEGGPVDAASRAKWVKAYRAVAQAAAEATR